MRSTQFATSKTYKGSIRHLAQNQALKKRAPYQEASTLTPYQGSKRCFGHYQCSKCTRKWQSAYSWANKGQECQRCSIMIYPHRQEPLKKGEEESKIDKNKSHDGSRCEKCQQLGYSCKSDDDYY